MIAQPRGWMRRHRTHFWTLINSGVSKGTPALPTATGSGVLGGTFFGVLPNLPVEDVMLTVVMAAIGAVTSYLVTLVLKFLFSHYRKR